MISSSRWTFPSVPRPGNRVRGCKPSPRVRAAMQCPMQGVCAGVGFEPKCIFLLCDSPTQLQALRISCKSASLISSSRWTFSSVPRPGNQVWGCAARQGGRAGDAEGWVSGSGLPPKAFAGLAGDCVFWLKTGRLERLRLTNGSTKDGEMALEAKTWEAYMRRGSPPPQQRVASPRDESPCQGVWPW